MVTRIVSIILLLVAAIFFICVLPPPPPGPEDASVALYMKSSKGITYDSEFSDSVGNTVNIGVILHLTQYIKSVTIKIEIGDSTEQSFTFGSTKDTVVYPLTFLSPGKRKITVTGSIEGQPDIVIKGSFTINGNPLVAENQKPVLTVPAAQHTGAGQSLVFPVSATDPDPAQQVTISVANKPTNATFFDNTFSWTPAMTDTGTVQVLFIATDNGSPAKSDTEAVMIYISAASVNHAPAWTVKTIQRSILPGVQFFYLLGNNCSDSDNDTLTFSLISGAPDNDTINGTTYSFTPTLSDTGKYTVRIVAKDPSGLTDTQTVQLTVSATVIPDTLPPLIKFLSPSKDTVISVDSIEIKVTCIDDNGINSTKGYCNNTAFDLKKSTTTANLWTGKIKGLTSGSYSTVKIVAEDSSAAKNKDSVSLRIKYDNDKTGPAIVLVTPNKDSVTTNTSSYTIIIKVTDASGVLSVNGASGATAYPGVKDTGSAWKINIGTLENNKLTAIVLTATDSSLKANKTPDTIYVKSVIINGYTITFDKNDAAATGTMDKQTINSGDSAKLLSNTLVKTGSTFSGWATSPTGAIVYKDGASYTMGTANDTLYAIWAVIPTFTLTYNGNTNSAGTVPSAVTGILSGASVTVAAVGTLVKSNYTFAGWNTAPNGSGTPYTTGSSIIITAATTLYAQWTALPTYSLAYDGNTNSGGTAPTTVSGIVTGTSVTVAAAGALVKTNYAFAGWNTAANGSGTDYAADAKITMTANTTLYAQWTQTYSLTYNGNSSTGGTAPSMVSGLNSGAVVTVAANTFTRTNYIFSSWNTKADGSGDSHAPNTNITITANTTLYAIWTQVFTLSYNGNSSTGGTAVPQVSGITSGSIVTVASNTFTKTNSSFSVWNTQANGAGASYAPGANISITSNTTLYAQWTTNTYYVHFDKNDVSATGSMQNQGILSGTQVNLVTIGFTKPCSDFAGWATSANGNVVYLNQGSVTMGSGDIYLYAKWTPKSGMTLSIVPDVQWNCGDGTSPTYSVSVTGATGVPSYSWYYDNNGTPATCSSASSLFKNYTSSTLTFYGQFPKNSTSIWCVVTDNCISKETNHATYKAHPIAHLPSTLNGTCFESMFIGLEAECEGATYEWYISYDGTYANIQKFSDIDDATWEFLGYSGYRTSTLSIKQLNSETTASYFCEVTNFGETIRSNICKIIGSDGNSCHGQ